VAFQQHCGKKLGLPTLGLRAGVAGASPLPAALVGRSLAKHSPRVLDPHFIAMLVCDSRTSSANGAFGWQERHESAGMRLVTAAARGRRFPPPWSAPKRRCGLWATLTEILILPKRDALTVFGLGPTMYAEIVPAFRGGRNHASIFYFSCSRRSGNGSWLLDIAGVARSLRGGIECTPRCVDSAAPPPDRTVYFRRRLQVRIVL
jgi:hypothetical protein